MKRLGLAVALLLVTGTASAAKVTTWKDPASAGKTYKKLAVFVLVHDAQVGRTSERMMASTLNGTTLAIPGNSFVTEAEYKDKEKVVARMKEMGFDGVVVTKVVAVDESQGQSAVRAYVSPYAMYGVGYYDGFGGYWGTFAPITYVGGYAMKTQVVQVETVLYDLGTNTLVWAQQSSMKNPDSTLEVIETVAKKAASGLRAEKFALK